MQVLTHCSWCFVQVYPGIDWLPGLLEGEVCCGLELRRVLLPREAMVGMWKVGGGRQLRLDQGETGDWDAGSVNKEVSCLHLPCPACSSSTERDIFGDEDGTEPH
mgnify:CR=1 FL=1